MITQTWALLIAAYRELNARKLFWITMALNVLVIGLFGSMGINSEGVSFLHWTFDSEFMNTRLVTPELFYKLQFTSWGIPFWLSWIATILALISTSGMVPELTTSGAVDTVLSKPIGRWRLFLTKYAAALLFVALQVTVFSLGCFLVIGIRGNAWEPDLLLAIPIVLAFFSFLYSFCAVVGMVTRSTIASLLLTLLFWFMVFIVNIADGMLVAQREGTMVRLEDARERLENETIRADKQIESQGEVLDADDNVITDPEQQRSHVNPAYALGKNRVADLEESAEAWGGWTSRVVMLKTALPKTQETIGLLERYLITEEQINELIAQRMGVEPPPSEDSVPAMADPRAQERVAEVYRSRTTLWVLGTSFAFEAVMLGIAGLIFVRRDF